MNLFVNVETKDNRGPDGEDDHDADCDLLGVGAAHTLPATLEHLAVV